MLIREVIGESFAGPLRFKTHFALCAVALVRGHVVHFIRSRETHALAFRRARVTRSEPSRRRTSLPVRCRAVSVVHASRAGNRVAERRVHWEQQICRSTEIVVVVAEGRGYANLRETAAKNLAALVV